MNGMFVFLFSMQESMSGLIQARRNCQRWNDNIKLELQHLAAATPAGPSLVAIQRHVAVTLATWDAVWGEYLHPKWAKQKMRLYGAKEKVLERYFKELEEEAAVVSQQRWGTRKELAVFLATLPLARGACCKVVERPISGRPTDRVKGKVVTVDELRTCRVSSAMNNPQPCEEELDRSKPTRPEGWKPEAGQVQHRLLQSAWSKRFEAPVWGLMWCLKLDLTTPGVLGKWMDRDCNAALNSQRTWEAPWLPLELCRWQHRGVASAKGKEYPTVGFKKLRDRAMLKLLLTSEHVFCANTYHPTLAIQSAMFKYKYVFYTTTSVAPPQKEVNNLQPSMPLQSLHCIMRVQHHVIPTTLFGNPTDSGPDSG
ncbi:hypothetical protein QJQ45_009582 [Haematococcus lacustris]|nr:hypothetical protein QJQ45_009582 [Haematococcus lacustris]